jgi:hypothetical protein
MFLGKITVFHLVQSDKTTLFLKPIDNPKKIKTMIKIAKQTGLAPEKVINRASKFFGKGGEGLEEKERTPCCISFEGGGGYVSISIYDEEKHRMVDVETREFEYQAKQFLRTL